jgi:hypothetical protein
VRRAPRRGRPDVAPRPTCTTRTQPRAEGSCGCCC